MASLTSWWKSVSETQLGRPLLEKATAFIIVLLLKVCFAAEGNGATKAEVESESDLKLLLGRFSRLRLNLGRLKRGLRIQRGSVEVKNLNLGFKPSFLLVLPLLVILFPSLTWLFILILVLPPPSYWNGRQARAQKSELQFSAEISTTDLNQSHVWRFCLTTVLRDIMSYSIAGMVALPREVSGELSSATTFEVEDIYTEDQKLVMNAVARLPNETLFKYRLRTGVVLETVEGEQCLFWDDPQIRVRPSWPLPEFWAPLGGFAGRRLGSTLQLTRLEVPVQGGIVVEGRWNPGDSITALALPSG